MKHTPGPACSVCTHPKRLSIEEKLAAGVSIRDISQQMGKGAPSFHAIQRHKANCMREAVLAAREAEAVVLIEEGESIVERCRKVNREAWALLTEAKSEQDRKVYASLLGQALKSLELEAKLLGEIGGPTTQVNTQVNVAVQAAPQAGPESELDFLVHETLAHGSFLERAQFLGAGEDKCWELAIEKGQARWADRVEALRGMLREAERRAKEDAQ